VEEIITVQNLSKRFVSKGKKGQSKVVEAVRGISFTVEQGEIFGFLGPNGAGKTTTLRMLTTLLPIDEGRAALAGFDVARQAAQVRSRIGYVSQLGGADDDATGREDLLLQGRLYGLGGTALQERVDEVLRALDLASIAERRVKTYSGGQRRRLDVALGIVHRPEVLFLDEPSTSLDPQNRANFWDHIRRLRDRGTTVFLTTHYLEEADALCDRVMIMDHGGIVAEGTPAALKRQVGGHSVFLSFKGGDDVLAEALALLREASLVAEAVPQEAGLRLYVDDGAAFLPALLRLLDSHRIALTRITVSEPTLDDVFLEKTGRSLRDTEMTSSERMEVVA
jgi:ABC-2 type transport system ATP-binding protein